MREVAEETGLAVTLVSPFYMQIAVDDAVGKGDSGLLVALAIGFGLFTLINVAATALRSFVSLQLGNVITFQMAVGLFHHLMRLPLPFFERRHIGDLISRFSATYPIKDLITEGLVAILVGLGALMLITRWIEPPAMREEPPAVKAPEDQQ